MMAGRTRGTVRGRGGVETAEDSRNFTQERVKKKSHCLTYLPLECIQYIL